LKSEKNKTAATPHDGAKSSEVLIKGNLALCEGAIAGGLDAYYGYPITPQNEVPEYMSRRLTSLGKVFIQAESELASINMVMGSAVAGFRAMTSSSSPGISLMQEGISYLAGCELPALIVNVQRGGPGLGNISGSQQDYFQAVKGGGHGDYHLITLAPATIQEMYDFAKESFALAEKYRNPVMILTDGVLAQMMEPASIPAEPPPPPSRTTSSWALNGASGGRAPRLIRSLLMAEGALEKHNWHLKEKYDEIIKNEVRCESYLTDDADIILVAYGIAARISRSAVLITRKNGIKAGLIRPITLWPFPYDMIHRAASDGKPRKKFLVVELNLGQMVEDVRLGLDGKADVEFLGRPGGGLPTAEEIFEKIKSIVI